MTTLYPAPAAVKSPRRMFALGLAKPDRECIAPYTAADREWAAAHLNASAADYAVEGPADFLLDEMAAESAAFDAYMAGLSFA